MEEDPGEHHGPLRRNGGAGAEAPPPPPPDAQEPPQEQEHSQAPESAWNAIARVNQAGVTLFQSRLFCQAAAAFARALLAAHEQAHRINEDTNDHDLGAPGRATMMRISFPAPSFPVPVVVIGETSSSAPQHSEPQQHADFMISENEEDHDDRSSSFLIYNKAACISNNQNQGGEGPGEEHHHWSRNNEYFTLSQVSAAVMFNAGLAHHLKCATTPEERMQNRSYRKSFQYYRTGASMLHHFFENFQLQQQQQHDDPSPVPHDLQEQNHLFKQIRLLYLALVNNMAQIHLHFSNRQGHNECCNRLRALLATLAGQGGGDLNDLQEDDHRFFVLNLIASQHLDQQAAATA